MKKSKKPLAFAVLMILIVCFTFAGCKGADDKPTDKEGEQNSTEIVNEATPTGDAQAVPTDSPAEETPTPEPTATSTPTPEPTTTSTPTPEPTATNTPTPEPTATSTPTPIPLKDVAIDKVNFPDALFREYVSVNFDVDRNGQLSPEEIKQVKEISIRQDGIHDLSGIEYFSELEELDISGSVETEVLDLSKNVNLVNVDCHHCEIRQLNVNGCVNLMWLGCEKNNLTSLDVSQCVNLTGMECDANNLTSLDISKCAELEYLDCSSNKLTSLDVSHCAKLTQLSCRNNQISSLDLSKCTKLEILECRGNVLTSLNLEKCPDLTELNCVENKLTALELSVCPKLTVLKCGENQIASLDLTKCADLVEINCEGNKISTLDVSNCKKLLHAGITTDSQVSLTGWILDGDTEGPFVLTIDFYKEDIMKELRKKFPLVEFVGVYTSDRDIIEIDRNFDRLMQEGELYCIDEAYKGYRDELPENRCKYFTQNGKKYGAPVGMDNNVGCLFANMDLLKKAGYETIPETYDELVKCCDKLTSLGIIPFGCAGSEGAEWCMCQVLETFIVNSCGAEAFEEILVNKVPWNDQGIIDAADLLKQMVDKGYFNQDLFDVDFETVQRYFTNGRYAFFLSDATNCYVFDEKHMNVKVSYFPMINAERANKGELSGGNLEQAVGVSSQSRRPELAAEVAFELGKLLSKYGYLDKNVLPVWPIDYDDSSKGNLTREAARLVATAHDYVAPEYSRLKERSVRRSYYSKVIGLIKYSSEDGTSFVSDMDYVVEWDRNY